MKRLFVSERRSEVHAVHATSSVDLRSYAAALLTVVLWASAFPGIRAALAWLWLGEVPSFLVLWGGLLVLVGVILVNTQRWRQVSGVAGFDENTQKL